jgi:putative flippase GtrA
VLRKTEYSSAIASSPPLIVIVLKRLLGSEFSRYFLASLFALGVDFFIFSAGIRLLHLSWATAATIGFFGGAMIAYLLSITFVFKKRHLSRTPLVEFCYFVFIGLCGLVVTQLVLYAGIETFGIIPEFSKVVAAVASFLFNYLLRKITLFRTIRANQAI